MSISISRRDFFKKILGAAATDAGAHAQRPGAPGSRPAVEAIKKDEAITEEAVTEEAIRSHMQNVQSKLFQSYPKTARNADGRSRQ